LHEYYSINTENRFMIKNKIHKNCTPITLFCALFCNVKLSFKTSNFVQKYNDSLAFHVCAQNFNRVASANWAFNKTIFSHTTLNFDFYSFS
jgi:hypothetical protein